MATDGIDGRFTEHYRGEQRSGRDGEAALVLARSGGHAAPRQGRGAPQLRADGLLALAAQDKDGVGPGVGVEAAGADERFQQGRGQVAFLEQIAMDRPQVLRKR